MWESEARCRWGADDRVRERVELKNDHHQVSYTCFKGFKLNLIQVQPRETVSHVVWKEIESTGGSQNSQNSQKSLKSVRTLNTGRRTNKALDKHSSYVYVRIPGLHESKPVSIRSSRMRSGPSRSKLSSFGSRRRASSGSIRVRAKIAVALTIKELSPTTCRLCYVTRVDLGGFLPQSVLSYYLRLEMGTAAKARSYFQKIKQLHECTADDGTAMGFRLMHGGYRGADIDADLNENRVNRSVSAKEKNKLNVKTIIKSHCALSELQKTYPWLEVFLSEVVKGRLSLNRPIGEKLSCLSSYEAQRIGKNLGGALRQRKTPQAGLYQWKMQNPAMVELFEQHESVEALMLVVSSVVVKQALWGLLWRVSTGACLNMLDVVSDINVIIFYLQTEGQQAFGWALLGMILLCLVLQLGVVYVQNRRNPMYMWREVFIVLSFMKPPVDAYRVATEVKMEPHHAFDVKTEQYLNKCIEVFAESIPGSTLRE